MGFILNRLLANKYARWIGLILLAVAAAFGYGEFKESQGKSKANKENEINKAKDYIDTRNRMDEADIVGDDPDTARRWLHERSKR